MAGVKFVVGVEICVSVFRVVAYDPGIFLSSENVYVLSYDIYHKLVVISNLFHNVRTKAILQSSFLKERMYIIIIIIYTRN